MEVDRSVLNVEEAPGLWLLRNWKHWKKLLESLSQRLLKPCGKLLDQLAGSALGLASSITGESSRRLQAARPPHCTASTSQELSSCSTWAQKGWELPGGTGWRWPCQWCLDFWADDAGYLSKALLANSNVNKGTCDVPANPREEQAWDQLDPLTFSKSLSLFQPSASAVLTQCWVEG